MSALFIGDKAPDFKADTSEGRISFHEWIGNNWCIFFSHPGDFTPVCTTELGVVAKLKKEFESRGVKRIGLSTDTVEDHKKWILDINETQNTTVDYPIIADEKREISKLYGMLDQTSLNKEGLPLTVRSVFIIDTKKIIRLIISYPASCGRNFDEILRVIDSLQLTTNTKLVTPVNWRVGEDVIVPPSIPGVDAEKTYGKMKCLKPYLRYVKSPQ